MKKKTKIIIISTVCMVALVIVTMLSIGLSGMIKAEIKIYQAEQRYFSDKSADNLYILCDSLYKSGSDDKIIRYFKDLLFTEKYNQISKDLPQEKLDRNYDYMLTHYLMSYIALGDKEGFKSELYLHFKDFRTDELKYHYIQESFQENLKDEPEKIKYICSEYVKAASEDENKKELVYAATFAQIWYEKLGDMETAEKMRTLEDKSQDELEIG